MCSVVHVIYMYACMYIGVTGAELPIKHIHMDVNLNMQTPSTISAQFYAKLNTCQEVTSYFLR